MIDPIFNKPPAYEIEEQKRFERIRKSIATRLTKACGHLSREDFDALVDKMTKVQIGKRLP